MANKHDPVWTVEASDIAQDSLAYELAGPMQVPRVRETQARLLGTNLFIRTEAFTTKMCDLLHDVGSRCPKCRPVFDRDANTVRNILVKLIDDTSQS